MLPRCRRAPAEREDGASGRAHHAWIRGGMMYAGFRGAAGHNGDGLAAPPVRTGGNKHGPVARRAAQRSDPAAETSPGWYAGPMWVRQLLRVLVVADIVGGSVRAVGAVGHTAGVQTGRPAVGREGPGQQQWSMLVSAPMSALPARLPSFPNRGSELRLRGGGPRLPWQRSRSRGVPPPGQRTPGGTLTGSASSGGLPSILAGHMRVNAHGSGRREEKASVVDNGAAETLSDGKSLAQMGGGFTSSSPNPDGLVALEERPRVPLAAPVHKEGIATSGSPPQGLLISMCAWESLHTIAIGGVAPHVTEISAALARRGHEVHLFVRAGYDMSQPRYELIHAVHVHRVPIELNPDFVTECSNMCHAFVEHMRETEDHLNTVFDIVHAHDWLAAKALVRMKQMGRKTVFTCHSTEVGRAGRADLDALSQRVQAIEAEACACADRVIAVSGKFCDEVKAQYLANGRSSKDKLRMVYNGIHPEAFREEVDVAVVKQSYGLHPDTPVILSVGRLIPQKGPDILIGAMPKLIETNPDAVVLFVGDGHMRDWLEKQVCLHAPSLVASRGVCLCVCEFVCVCVCARARTWTRGHVMVQSSMHVQRYD